MVRHTPAKILDGIPCSIVAVTCAVGGEIEYLPELKNDGYATLDAANRFIRKNLDVKKRMNFKRGERPLLKDLHFDGRAIVCVYGHFIYLDQEEYWSFFDNENDEVVSLWLLKE